MGVDNLERRQRSAREKLEILLAEVAVKVPEPVNPDPLGAENGPHQYTYKLGFYPDQDTVIANEGCSRPASEGTVPSRTEPRKEPADKGRVLKLAPDELVRLAPRLNTYLLRPDPTWPDVVEAAAYLRSDLDVSKSLWGEACLAMGREQAAIAIAIVSVKDPGYFRTTPGGYFHGMVAKAKAGELNLDRTLWGMRRAKESVAPGNAAQKPGRGGGGSTHRL